MLKNLFLLLFFLFVSLHLNSCGTQKDPINIGAVLVLSGPAAYVGEEVRDGMTMAVEEINQQGGVNGRRLKLLIQDSTTDVNGEDASLKTIFNDLENIDPLVFISCLSSLSVKMAPLAEKRKKLMVSLVATAPGLTENRSWTYRYWPTAEHEAPPMVDIFHNISSSEGKLGVIYLDDAYGRSVLEDLRKRCSVFNTTLIPAPFPISRKNFSTEASLIKSTDATALIGFDGHIINALKALRESGYQGDIISTTTATLPSVVATPEAEGVYVTAPAIYNKNFHFVDDIKNRYKEKFAKPFTQYSANGYDFIYILSGLLEDEKVTPENLKKLFEKGFVYSGVFGNIELQKGSKDILFPLFSAKIQNGQIVYQ